MAQVKEVEVRQVNTAEYSCVICKSKSSQRCSNCRKVSYCSKEHQKTDWKSHKPDCFPAEIAYNDIVGRYLVATRDIQPGEIIVKEKPLVSGPKNCGDKNGICIFPICLSCFRIVSSKYFCTYCRWPMCNEQCEKAAIHLKNECCVFAARNIKPSFRLLKDTRAYDNVIVLRALLCKKSDPKVWVKIRNLQSHVESRSRSDKCADGGPLSTMCSVKFIIDVCGLKEFTYEEIDHVVGALETNVFGNDDSSVRSSSTYFRASSYLYFTGSMPAHNCQPNTSWTIQPNSEFRMKATVRIPCGESITDLYTAITVGTLARRKFLKKKKYFDCSCLRCEDPFELGTNFSSVKCQKCDNGFLVSSKPLDNSADWKCQSCNKTESVNFIEKLVDKVSNEISCTMNSIGGADAESILNCVSRLKELGSKYSPKFLHQCHYLLFEIDTYIIQKISFFFSAPSIRTTLEEMTDSDKNELIQAMLILTQKCLDIVNIILPGHSILRGRLLYFLQQGLTLSLHLSLSTKQSNSRSIDQSTEYEEQLKSLEESRQEAILIFNNVPEGKEEFLLRKRMLETSTELDFIRKILVKDK